MADAWEFIRDEMAKHSAGVFNPDRMYGNLVLCCIDVVLRDVVVLMLFCGMPVG